MATGNISGSDQIPFYLSYMRSMFEQRKNKNKNYSLRAYARDLNLNPATLSMILSGRRSLPIKYIATVIKKLNLDNYEADKFTQSLNAKLDQNKCNTLIKDINV